MICSLHSKGDTNQDGFRIYINKNINGKPIDYLTDCVKIHQGLACTEIKLPSSSSILHVCTEQIWNCLFKKIELDKFGIGIEVCYKRVNPQINLPFNFLIQKYFFHDNPTWNINLK